MQDSLTLRKSAARVGIDLKTAFRWRHRFLQTSARNNSNDLSGIVAVDETFFLESCKDKRHLAHRASRKRGGQGSKNKKEDKISVVIVRDRSGRVSDLADPISVSPAFMRSWRRSLITIRFYVRTGIAGIKRSLGTTILLITV